MKKTLLSFPCLDYITLQNSDEYEQLARRLDALAAEFRRAHDENIKAEIIALSRKWPNYDRPVTPRAKALVKT